MDQRIGFNALITPEKATDYVLLDEARAPQTTIKFEFIVVQMPGTCVVARSCIEVCKQPTVRLDRTMQLLGSCIEIGNMDQNIEGRNDIEGAVGQSRLVKIDDVDRIVVSLKAPGCIYK